MPDVAHIITIGGRDVSADVVDWEVIDDEEAASQLKVELASPNLRYAAAFDTGQEMEIRFGYPQEMSPPASLPVQDQDRSYTTKEHDTVTVIGRDPLQKMGGGKQRGNHEKGTNIDVLKKQWESAGLEGEAGAGKTVEFNKPPAMNENKLQVARKYGRTVGPQESSTGNQPKSPLGDEKGGGTVAGTKIETDQGHSFSSAEGWTPDGKGRDDNRSKNHHNAHSSEPLTGALELRGYPKLRAKTMVALVGVGDKDSGSWYVKQVHHRGGKGKAFTTSATLVRGGTGKGGAGGDQPVVMYTDIWNKGKVYMGPRKMQGGNSDTISRGEEYFVSFKVQERVQRNRGGGEPKKGKGRGLQLRKEWEELENGPAAEAGGK